MRFFRRMGKVFWQPKAALGKNPLPQVELLINKTNSAPDVFPHPRLTCSATVIHEDVAIGSLLYGVHQEGLCLYVLVIEVDTAHRRQQFGLAILWALFQRYRLPLVPVNVLDSAQPFWSTAQQRLAKHGIVLGAPLSRFDLSEQYVASACLPYATEQFSPAPSELFVSITAPHKSTS